MSKLGRWPEGAVPLTLDDLQQNETMAVAYIVGAFVEGNRLSADELPHLIEKVRRALVEPRPHTPAGDEATSDVVAHEKAKSGAETADSSGQMAIKPLVPAVPVASSISQSAIICLDCGREFKSLRRHLRTAHDLTPGQYRLRWELPEDYPMVAPNYSELRAKLTPTAFRYSGGRKKRGRRR